VIHYASSSFWQNYESLPRFVKKSADRSYELLKKNPNHASLHFKKIGKLWSVRVSRRYRALSVEVSDGFLWFWIGSHADYDKLITEL
jgi:hypothetical protein